MIQSIFKRHEMILCHMINIFSHAIVLPQYVQGLPGSKEATARELNSEVFICRFWVALSALSLLVRDARYVAGR